MMSETKSKTTPATVKVISPATLKEGATFEATVDGIDFTVVVPEGGVGEGDDFEVPYPTKKEETSKTGVSLVDPEKGAVNAYDIPTGKWRHELCDCCSACCCPFLMGWCCVPILMAQVMERMKFNFLGCPNESGGSQPICIVFTAVTLAVVFLGAIIIRFTGYFGVFVWSAWGLYLIIVFTCVRFEFRKRYQIKGCCCDNPVDDCCLSYWCSCCSAIQMARHLEDPDKAKYNAWTTNGADDNAPEIV